VPYC